MTALHSISHSFLKVLTHIPWLDIPGDLWRASKGIVRALWHDGEHPELKALRDLHCRRCPMYCEKWQTCGEPGDMDEETAMKIGCWCYLPLANNDPGKDCWARASGLENVGWPDELRPKNAFNRKA